MPRAATVRAICSRDRRQKRNPENTFPGFPLLSIARLNLDSRKAKGNAGHGIEVGHFLIRVFVQHTLDMAMTRIASAASTARFRHATNRGEVVHRNRLADLVRMDPQTMTSWPCHNGAMMIRRNGHLRIRERFPVYHQP